MFYICLLASAPTKQEAQTKSSFLVNKSAVLYSSPITGSSGLCAVALFLQQADDKMSREKLFFCLVYACKKALKATPNLPNRDAACAAPQYLPGLSAVPSNHPSL